MKAQGISFRHAVELLRSDNASLAGAGGARADIDGSQVAAADRARCRQCRGPGTGRELLSRNAEADAGCAGVPGQARPDVSRDGRATSGWASPIARWVTGCRHPIVRPEPRCADGCRNSAFCGRSGHEHFTGCIVFPIFDRTGQVVEMYGRKIADDHLRAGTPLHLYLPGPHRGVWNEPALEVSKEIILCESIIDALTFWCAGYRNVTASYGVNGFTDDHRAALKKYETRRVLISYDRDEAGEKAARHARRRTDGDGHRMLSHSVSPPAWTPTTMRLKVQPAAKTLGILLNQAHWLGKGTPPERETVEIIPAPVESMPAASEDPEPGGVEEPIEPAAKEEISRACFSLAAERGSRRDSTLARSNRQRRLRMTCRPRSSAHEMVFTRGDRRYRVRGFAKNLTHDVHQGESDGIATATGSTSIRSISTRRTSARRSSNRRLSRWA